ncbi:hypothetical protein CALCODRAFT_437395, partial [Calocera cornea HHB12733]
MIEESLIARCRAKGCIVQLQEGKHGAAHATQRGMSGHILVYPQKPESLVNILPLQVHQLADLVCVVFVGANPPSREWLVENARPLVVRRRKVMAALMWLKANNPLYSDVRIDETALNGLQEEDILPYHIEHQTPDPVAESLTSWYDAYAGADLAAAEGAGGDSSDVTGDASLSELRAAAVRHLRQKGGGFLQVPHGPHPMNTFYSPELLPLTYPTLFPYGLGGLEDRHRKAPLSFARHVAHLLR